MGTGALDEPALSVRSLTKRFGDRVAYQDVSFEVARGEVFGFLGPNGAGKTTTVRTLATLIAPSSGAATVAGLELIPDNGVAIRRRIAVMPEAPGLYLRLSVQDNLACFAEPRPRAVPDPGDRTWIASRWRAATSLFERERRSRLHFCFRYADRATQGTSCSPEHGLQPRSSGAQPGAAWLATSRSTRSRAGRPPNSVWSILDG